MSACGPGCDHGDNDLSKFKDLFQEPVHFEREQKPPGRTIKFVCWFSKHVFDIHDYPVSFGGNGEPWHFYTYTCWNCGMKFGI